MLALCWVGLESQKRGRPGLCLWDTHGLLRVADAWRVLCRTCKCMKESTDAVSAGKERSMTSPSCADKTGGVGGQLGGGRAGLEPGQADS